MNRPKAMILKRLPALARVAFCCGLAVAALPLSPQGLGSPALARDVAISLTDAREAAVQAVAQGDLATAEALASRLLAADPQDPLARQVMATIALRRGDLPKARVEARAAHANARTDRQRHEAAKLAAVIAEAEGRDFALRWWLRAAGEDSPTAQDRKLAARALARVRDRSPWSLRFGASISPSNNVNGGADNPFLVVDGHPEFSDDKTGAFRDGEALSGLVMKANADLAWRLARSKTAQTQLTFGLDLKRVKITDQTTFLKDSDLGSDAMTFGLEHELTDANSRNRWDFGAEIGLSNSGGDSSREFSARLGRSLSIGKGTVLTFGASWTVEHANRNGDVSRMPQLTLRGQHRLAGGGRLGFTLTGYDAQTDHTQRKRHGGLVQVSYAPGKPIGPFDVTGAVGLSFADYPDYRVFNVPVGREDATVFGQFTLMARDVSWQGFSPQVTLRVSRSDSNISKFDTLETGILLGLKSQF